MHSTQKKAYAEISHQHLDEGKNHIKVKALRTGKPRKAIAMEGHTIHHESDKRPDFFRIPCPITSPRHIRPNSSDKDTDAQKEHGRIKQYPTENHELSCFTGQAKA